jgi:hypothetical protein
LVGDRAIAHWVDQVSGSMRDIPEFDDVMACSGVVSGSWVDRVSGSFKDDPGFEEVLRYGREYRESLDDRG